MQKKALVSIIIPIYNVEKYIEKCLNSAINQTYQNIEVLCIDDCGQDQSIIIAEKLAEKDDRIKIIKNESNKGIAFTRNVGLKSAKGEYLYFLDSDDYIEKSTIEKMLKISIQDNSDIVLSGVKVTCEDGLDKDIQGIQSYFNFKPLKNPEETNTQNIKYYFQNMPGVVWNRLYKSSFLKENDIWFIKKNVVHEDEGFNIKILSSLPKISFSNNIGLYYLVRKESIMREAEADHKKRMENLELSLEDALNYMVSHKKSKKIIKIVKRSSLYNKKKKYKLKRIKKWIFTLKIEKEALTIRLFGIPLINWKK